MLWLYWVFVATGGLSLVAVSGAHLQLRRLLIAVVLLLWCTSLVALQHVESSRAEIESVSLASAGGFLITGPPEKPDFVT